MDASMDAVVLDPGVAMNLRLLACQDEIAADSGLRFVWDAAPPQAGPQVDFFLDFIEVSCEAEAAAAAAAQAGSLALATDAPKLRRRFEAIGGRTLSTATLLHRWADATRASRGRATQCVHALIERAFFAPPACDPALAWWNAQARSAAA